MHLRFSLTKLGRFFFKPLVLHLQATDLLIELLLVGCRFLSALRAPILKQRRACSKSCCFQAATWLVCTSYSEANWAVVLSPRNAARATFALNAPPNTRRFLVILDAPDPVLSSTEFTPYHPVQFLGSTSAKAKVSKDEEDEDDDSPKHLKAKNKSKGHDEDEEDAPKAKHKVSDSKSKSKSEAHSKAKDDDDDEKAESASKAKSKNESRDKSKDKDKSDDDESPAKHKNSKSKAEAD